MTEIASSSAGGPLPFVLFGALLFALAAAAGHVLRTNPLLFRHLVTGFDGVRDSAPTLRQPAQATADGPPPPATDAMSTLASMEPQTLTNQTFSGQTLTDFVDPNAVAPTLNGAGSANPGSLGGQDGGVSRLGDAAGGFDSLGKSSLTTPDATGFGGAENLYESPQTSLPDPPSDVPQDVDTSHVFERPTDYQVRPITEADVVPQTAHGGGIGGGQGSDALARGFTSSGSELAHGNGGLGATGGEVAGEGQLAGGQGGLGGAQGSDLLARGAGAPVDALAHAQGGPPTPIDSGLGGVHGGVDGPAGANSFLGRGWAADGLDLASLPTNGAPGDLGFQGGAGSISGHQGVGDALARSGMPGGGASLQHVAGTVVTPDAIVGEAGSVWLAAGALARAGSLDWDAEDSAPERPTEVHELVSHGYACPSCHRPLPFSPRFCGYCGEPMDRTIG